MKSIKFILILAFIASFQQIAFGSGPIKVAKTFSQMFRAPQPTLSAIVSTKIEIQALPTMQANDEDMILLKDYLALKACESFATTQRIAKQVWRGTTAIVATCAAMFLF